MTVVRKTDKQFAQSEQTLLEAIADYASISLVNTRLFRALAHSAEAAQAGEQSKNTELLHLRKEIQSTVQVTMYPLELLLGEKMGTLTDAQKQALGTIQAGMKHLYLLLSEQKTQPR
jgi:hypothetical protein